MFVKTVIYVLLIFSLTACSPDKGALSSANVAASAPVGSAASAPVVVDLAALAPNTEEKILNFNNWVDYIPESMLKDFEKETGIQVNYHTYTDNEELEKRVRVKTEGVDLVVPGLNYGQSQATLGYYRPLDKSLLPNYKNLDPEFLKSMAISDPGNK